MARYAGRRRLWRSGFSRRHRSEEIATLDAVTLSAGSGAEADCRAALAKAPDIRRPWPACRLAAAARATSQPSVGIARAGEIGVRLAPPRRCGRSCRLPPGNRGGALALAHDLHALSSMLERALGEELPLNARDGGFVRAGFDRRSTQARLRDDSRRSSPGSKPLAGAPPSSR
jgi:DNA mismatch repair protein MutS